MQATRAHSPPPQRGAGISSPSNSGIKQNTEKSIAQRVMDVTLASSSQCQEGNKAEQLDNNDIVKTIKSSSSSSSSKSGSATTNHARPILKPTNYNQIHQENLEQPQSDLSSCQTNVNVENSINDVESGKSVQKSVSTCLKDQMSPESSAQNDLKARKIEGDSATSCSQSPRSLCAEITGTSPKQIDANCENSTNTHSNGSNMNENSASRLTSNSSNEQLVTCQSVFKQVISKNMKPPTNVSDERIPKANHHNSPNSANQNFVRATRISLETRVPHPSRHNGFHSEEEEVSYLNLGARNVNNRAACSSLDNATKPILLAAAREQRLGLQSRATASSQQLRPSLIQLQQHQFSLPNRPQISSPHEYEGMNSEYDEYDARYDNALVEKRIRQKQIEDEQQAAEENNRLESLYNCSTEDNSKRSITNNRQQQQQQPQQRQQSSDGSTSSIPASPKAKSAPATPCNITPTAFHQQNLTNELSSTRESIAGSGQVCFGFSAKDACRARLLEASSVSERHKSSAMSMQELDEIIRMGERAYDAKDYQAALEALSQAIDCATQQEFDGVPVFKLFGKRAEVHFELEDYKMAIADSMRARELNPKWAQAYLLEGRAKMVGEPLNSLPVFAFGLSQDPSNFELLDGLLDATLKSCYAQEFKPKLEKLRSMNLDRKAFIVVSVIGQEILAKGEHIKQAVVILESALKLETSEDKRLKSSVLSTVALASCLLKDYDRAVGYMRRELSVESELEDVAGQCRVLSNLGFTYYKMREFDKSLESHRKQLNLAMKSNLYQQASLALNAIGHVHLARNDYPGALTSHTRCLDILRQLADNQFAQFKEILAIGHVHSMMGDLMLAEERYKEADKFLDSNADKLSTDSYRVGRIMHRFNAAYLLLKRLNFREAERYYQDVIHLAREFSKFNPGLASLYQMRAFNGLGHTCRLAKRFKEARVWFDCQLKEAIGLGDLEGQSQALCNLGMVCQHFKDYTQSRNYFEENLRLVDKNPLLLAYAHSYMASVHFLSGHYAEAQIHYENSLCAFKELGYCTSEAKTIELNIALVQERVGHQDLGYMNSLNSQTLMMTGSSGTTSMSTRKKIMTAS